MTKPKKEQNLIRKDIIAPQDADSLPDSDEIENAEPEIGVFRPDREGIRKVLGDLEADVMEYIWQNYKPADKGILVRDIYEHFRLTRTIAYTTVMTTTARLAKKHLLTVSRLENVNAYAYSPALSESEFVNNFVGRILENLLVSFFETTSAHLNQLEATPEISSKIAALRSRLHNIKPDAGDNES